MRTIIALAAIFLIAHLAFLPTTLADIDSVNFALGVRDFDVGQHRPHPPGSPVFIALAKGSTAVFHGMRVPSTEPRAIAFWSALSGALMLPLLLMLFETLDGDLRRAFWSAALAALAPLAWFTAGRPMSDVTGLFLAIAAQWLVLRAWKRNGGATALIAGAMVAGLAAGVRVQTAALTAPVLTAALILVPGSIRTRARVATAGAALVGVLCWVVPLLIANGGLTSYLTALGTQADEDFAGVVMLWTTPTLRVAFHAFVNAFVWPWGTLALGTVVVCVAAAGFVAAAARNPGHLWLLAVLFAPYALFHLLLQETLTLRYALPLIPPVAYLFVRGAQLFRVSPFLEIAVVAVALVTTVPQATAFARGAPAFAALKDATAQGGRIAGHAGIRRLHEWLEERGETRTTFVRAPHGFEWLTLIEAWRQNPETRLQFLANPKRTDYRTLFDPYSRQTTTLYKWPFPEWPHLGGARPMAVERIEFSPPGWMLDRGWSVTAELAGITELEGYGPHRRPSIAWIRARNGSATLMIGGRHLGARGESPARLSTSISGTPLAEWSVEPGYFFRTVQVPAAILTGTGYIPFSVSASGTSGQAPVPVKLEQFDVQPPGNVMAGLAEGWYEPEYDRRTGRAWRWTGERAVLWVRPVGRDVTLEVNGESPLQYFDAAPTVRIGILGEELARFSPQADFRWQVTLPSALLERSNGQVVLESDKWFVPAERDGAADRRRLALRIYSYAIK